VSCTAFSVEYAFQGRASSMAHYWNGRGRKAHPIHSDAVDVESYTLILLIFCVGDDIEEMIDAAVDRFNYVTYLVSCYPNKSSGT
jgi:hypothetical protein